MAHLQDSHLNVQTPKHNHKLVFSMSSRPCPLNLFCKCKQRLICSKTGICPGFKYCTDVFIMSIECFIIATECAFFRNKGNSTLIAAGGISVVWILVLYADYDTHSSLARFPFFKAFTTAFNQSYSATALEAVTRLAGVTNPWNRGAVNCFVVMAAGGMLV